MHSPLLPRNYTPPLCLNVTLRMYDPVYLTTEWIFFLSFFGRLNLNGFVPCIIVLLESGTGQNYTSKATPTVV